MAKVMAVRTRRWWNNRAVLFLTATLDQASLSLAAISTTNQLGFDGGRSHRLGGAAEPGLSLIKIGWIAQDRVGRVLATG